MAIGKMKFALRGHRLKTGEFECDRPGSEPAKDVRDPGRKQLRNEKKVAARRQMGRTRTTQNQKPSSTVRGASFCKRCGKSKQQQKEGTVYTGQSEIDRTQQRRKREGGIEKGKGIVKCACKNLREHASNGDAENQDWITI